MSKTAKRAIFHRYVGAQKASRLNHCFCVCVCVFFPSTLCILRDENWDLATYDSIKGEVEVGRDARISKCSMAIHHVFLGLPGVYHPGTQNTGAENLDRLAVWSSLGWADTSLCCFAD